jgi:hypothetical protein
VNNTLLPFPHCGRTGCPCPHDGEPTANPGGCVVGWIETTMVRDGRGYDAVKPCPLCRGDRMPYIDEIEDDALGRARWHDRLRRTNARAAHNEDEW